MTSISSLTSCLFLFGAIKAQDGSVSCDNPVAPLLTDIPNFNPAGLSNVRIIQITVDEPGLLSLELCNAATTVADFGVELLDSMNNSIGFFAPVNSAVCGGVDTCEPGFPCLAELPDIPPNFEGTLRLVNFGTNTGDVQITIECGVVLPDLSVPSTTDSTDSTDGPDSGIGSGSGSGSDDSESVESAESMSDESASGASLVEVESIDDAEVNANGRNARFNAVVDEKGASDDGLAFVELIWIVVAVFVLLNTVLCVWLYKMRQAKKPQVSFGEPKHAVLQIETQ